MKKILIGLLMLLSIGLPALNPHIPVFAGNPLKRAKVKTNAPVSGISKPQALPADADAADHDKPGEGGYLQFREYFSEPWRVSGQTIPLMKKKILALSLVALVLGIGIGLKKLRRNTIYES
jgi:hypothetical protein